MKQNRGPQAVVAMKALPLPPGDPFEGCEDLVEAGLAEWLADFAARRSQGSPPLWARWPWLEEAEGFQQGRGLSGEEETTSSCRRSDELNRLSVATGSTRASISACGSVALSLSSLDSISSISSLVSRRSGPNNGLAHTHCTLAASCEEFDGSGRSSFLGFSRQGSSIAHEELHPRHASTLIVERLGRGKLSPLASTCSDSSRQSLSRSPSSLLVQAAYTLCSCEHKSCPPHPLGLQAGTAFSSEASSRGNLHVLRSCLLPVSGIFDALPEEKRDARM